MPVLPSAYNPIIPQPSDDLSFSQPQILNNFGAIQSLIDVNHYDFTGDILATGFNTNAGKHFFVEMPQVTTAPTTLANEVGFYCQADPITGNPAMFLAKKSSSAGSNAYSFSEFVATPWVTPGAFGWTRLASGMLIKFGTNNGAAGPTISIPLNGSGLGPDFVSVYTALITASTFGSSATPNFPAAFAGFSGTFNLNVYTNLVIGFNWLVIGS
jgi:hypothetical protein